MHLVVQEKCRLQLLFTYSSKLYIINFLIMVQVCHYHLVAFCPHDLFPNTKSDLGVCEKLHDDALRADFLKSNRVAQYEAEFLGYLERLIADLER